MHSTHNFFDQDVTPYLHLAIRGSKWLDELITQGNFIMVTCEFCSRSFSRNSNMLRHKRTAHADVLESREEGELSESAKEEKRTYSHDDNKYSVSENGQDTSLDDEEDDPWK